MAGSGRDLCDLFSPEEFIEGKVFSQKTSRTSRAPWEGPRTHKIPQKSGPDGHESHDSCCWVAFLHTSAPLRQPLLVPQGSDGASAKKAPRHGALAKVPRGAGRAPSRSPRMGNGVEAGTVN